MWVVIAVPLAVLLFPLALLRIELALPPQGPAGRRAAQVTGSDHVRGSAAVRAAMLRQVGRVRRGARRGVVLGFAGRRAGAGAVAAGRRSTRSTRTRYELA
jgi:hypothetical protein